MGKRRHKISGCSREQAHQYSALTFSGSRYKSMERPQIWTCDSRYHQQDDNNNPSLLKNHDGSTLAKQQLFSCTKSFLITMPNQEAKTPLIIDADFGVDDVTSVLAALVHKKMDIAAITVVDGNVSVERGVENCKILLNLTQKLDIPVYRGATTPIIAGLVEKRCWPGHAADGLGGFTESKQWEAFAAQYLPYQAPIKISDESAAQALVRMVTEKPGFYTILMLGPLTNLAIAILMDPQFLFKVQRLVVMGGSLHAKGNSSRVAEFRSYCPQCIVCRKYGKTVLTSPFGISTLGNYCRAWDTVAIL
ncbi:inosine-uridine preferring nucleoside hydrolase-domain-containing protein [Chytridium lagenaria]|nr:inosine-uridine preferring nucleoside hydrolase-domain-containing protein [Chytridium lagenaria]